MCLHVVRRVRILLLQAIDDEIQVVGTRVPTAMPMSVPVGPAPQEHLQAPLLPVQQAQEPAFPQPVRYKIHDGDQESILPHHHVFFHFD